MDTSLVQMIEQDGIEKEYVKSPFRFHDGIRAVLDNSCVSCSPDRLHRACVKGLIDDVDFRLMRYLLKYQFLSRRHIELCYAYDEAADITPETRKKLEAGRTDLKRRLKKLMGYGLILRYYLTWDKDPVLDVSERTPCYYRLSESAIKIIAKKNFLSTSLRRDYEKIVTEPGEELVLSRLVTNQFHIMFSHQQGDRIVDTIYFQPVAIKGYNFTLDLVYRVSDSDYTIFNKDGYLAVLVVRKSPDWQQSFLLRLALLCEYAKWHPGRLGTPVVMVVCEDDLHIKEAYLAKCKKKETRNISMYFTTDSEIMNEGVLSGVYSCELVSAKDVLEPLEEKDSVFDDVFVKADIKDAAKLVEMRQLELNF